MNKEDLKELLYEFYIFCKQEGLILQGRKETLLELSVAEFED
jgi:hypothetical protein